MSITSLASRLAFAVLLMVTAFAAVPLHSQQNRADIAVIDGTANL